MRSRSGVRAPGWLYMIGWSGLLLLAGAGALRAQQPPPDPNVTHAGRMIVPAGRMAALCTTMVTPSFPPGVDSTHSKTVVVRSLVHHTGTVQPLYAVSGDHALESAAMSAARLYRFHPYMVDGQPAEVTTEIAITFLPGQPGGLIRHPNP